ncbi:MAG: hypothetical protein ACREHG_09210 [Candidatus Saccharimonadales bacterium]
MNVSFLSYIGVTGIMHRYEAESLLGIMPDNNCRKLMLGVLVSDKTLHLGRNNHPNSHPQTANIADIFPDDPRALNFIHYYAENDRTLADDLFRLAGLGGGHLHGFQLNMPWPNARAIEQYRAWFPEHHIVLQIRTDAMRIAIRSPQEIAARIVPYQHLVNTVLLDASGGYGKSLSVESAYPILAALLIKFPHIGRAVAGGLCAKTLPDIRPLVRDHPDLSFDAQGRLRKPDGTLDLQASAEYLVKGLEICGIPAAA